MRRSPHSLQDYKGPYYGLSERAITAGAFQCVLKTWVAHWLMEVQQS
jgi:hypothetical protein